MPDELSPAHNIWGREVRSGIAPLGRNYARTEAVRTNQIVRGRALYDDGQMINSNVINHVTKERFGGIHHAFTFTISLKNADRVGKFSVYP